MVEDVGVGVVVGRKRRRWRSVHAAHDHPDDAFSVIFDRQDPTGERPFETGRENISSPPVTSVSTVVVVVAVVVDTTEHDAGI